jgi:hypothetical protein
MTAGPSSLFLLKNRANGPAGFARTSVFHDQSNPIPGRIAGETDFAVRLNGRTASSFHQSKICLKIERKCNFSPQISSGNFFPPKGANTIRNKHAYSMVRSLRYI